MANNIIIVSPLDLPLILIDASAIALGNKITDASVISAITNESNWSLDFTDPGGILAQLSTGSWYFDSSTKIKYEYDGTELYRFQTNVI